MTWMLILLCACSSEPASPSNTVADGDTDTESDTADGSRTDTAATDTDSETGGSTTAETSVTGATGATGDTALDEGLYPDVAYDCTLGVPAGPFVPTPVSGVTTTEDFVFDTLGNALAAGAGDVVVSYTSGGVATVVGPSFNSRPFDILPDGRILIGDTGGRIVELDPVTGGTTLYATIPFNLGAVDVDADGLVLAAYNSPGHVTEIDGGGSSTGIDTPANQLYGAGLSPDEQTLYVAEYAFEGRIFSYDRSTGAWTGPTQFTALPGGRLGGGIATDICGNVYIVAPSDCSLWRADPATGDLEQLWEGVSTYGRFCASIEFGSGLGGWDAHTLYMSTYEELLAFPVGVPGRPR